VRENVAGNITLGLDDVLADLESYGYAWQSFVIPACAVNAPQRRDRVFVVAYAKGDDSRGLSFRTRKALARLTGSCENVADTKSERRREEREHQLHRPTKRITGSGGDQLSRATQSELGGVLDGVSRRLDEHRWPAYWGEQQHEWEPNRLGTDIKNRPARLKALGNAVNPMQIYPILAAIKQIDDMLHNESA
jgi:DNA (cytosine-5)-methyltransferase 1